MHSVIAVTGAAGFVGTALCRFLTAKGFLVRPIVRTGVPDLTQPGAQVGVTLAGNTDWRSAVAGVDTVIHLAAKVPTMDSAGSDLFAQIQRNNVTDTLRLARLASEAGVRRFVFLSSIKVNGEVTLPGKGFSESDPPSPMNAYAAGKLEAELGLREIALHAPMECVIIRSPLVYGPQVRSNFALMMHAVTHQWPLPLGALHNQRSLLAIDNLIDFILLCVTHPAAANQTFLVSDGRDLSTTELLRAIAAAMGVPARLFPLPAWLLVGAGTLLGRRAMVQRLCGNLQADIAKARKVLAWSPPITVEEGLRRTVAGPRVR
ncbi:MAG: NAD-dependent epimerase/dehydratase family protein [Rhodoferax sp.]|nr:NAD-dependent epimerase/dehydratase family protein [Rhodoferax sp.]MCF8207887.1 NAD-dependent epimerase/dehydratase family protein [Rhodoferax sp.]